MKAIPAIPAILAVVLVSGTLATLITRSHYTAKLAALQPANEATSEPTSADRAKARVAAHRQRQGKGTTQIIHTTSKEQTDPAAILETLAATNITGQDRTAQERKIVHHLETLAEIGEKSIPPISEYLATGEDVPFQFPGRLSSNFLGPNGNSQPLNISVVRSVNAKGDKTPIMRQFGFNSAKGSPTSGYLVPPTLRMGLFQALSQIGGNQAEEELANSLSLATRGLEVAFLDTLLEKLAPGVHKDLVLSVTKELLRDSSTANDYQHRQQLFSILIRHRDHGFVQDAQTLLVNADGKLDNLALNYLNTLLKADAVPLLAKALENPALQDWAKSSLSSYILRYAGQHPQADTLFKQIMSQKMDAADKNRYQSPQFRALSGLFYNANPEIAAKRKALLDATIASTTDEKLRGMLESTSKKLEHRMNSEIYNYNGEISQMLFIPDGAGGATTTELRIESNGKPGAARSNYFIVPGGGFKRGDK